MKISDFFTETLRDGQFEVLGIIDSVTELPMLTFIESEKYIDALLQKKNIQCVITRRELVDRMLSVEKMGVVISESPRLDFFRLHQRLSESEWYPRKQFRTKIDETAQISNHAYVSEHNVKIGRGVIIEPFVMIYPNVEIEDNSIIRAGAVIGGEGFEYKRNGNEVFGVTHLGGVKIGKNVEIQNNTCVDKAVYPWDDTIIEDYVKIDNLVHVAHAVKIGHGTMLVANSGLGGRVEIAPNTWIGFGATIRNGLKVGGGGRVNMGAVVTKNVGENEAVSGNFAIRHQDFIEHMKNLVKK